MDKIIKKLSKIENTIFSKDHLLTWEKSMLEIEMLLDTTNLLKKMYESNHSLQIFHSGLAISNFRDKSTRTRFSFSSAANLLGLSVADLDEEKSQLSHGETVQETANMISFLTEVIGIRDDMYPGEGDRYQREVAAALDYGYNNGILHQRPAIVNLQSDIDHPTQTLADFSMLKEYFGDLNQLKGKKMAVTWAYSPSYGKPMSVPQGLIGLGSRFGMDISLAYPEGYDLNEDILELAKSQSAQSGGSFEVSNDMKKAFKDADIVYPKSWAPRRIMDTRTELLRKADKAGLVALEKEALAENAKYTDWECNKDLMNLTNNGRALYMHCLPADITDVNCTKGEVSEEVFRKYQKETYLEAGYKPFVIAAMILLSKVKNPAKILNDKIKLQQYRRTF